MKTLNPYKIHWLILTPITGKPTKRDQKIIKQVTGEKFCIIYSSRFARHCNSKEEAEMLRDKIKGLFKSHSATIITDKQFSMITTQGNEINIPFTSRQLREGKTVK